MIPQPTLTGRIVNQPNMVTSKHHRKYVKIHFVVHVSPPTFGSFYNDNPIKKSLLQKCYGLFFSYVGYYMSNLHHSLFSFLFWFQPQNIIYVLVEI